MPDAPDPKTRRNRTAPGRWFRAAWLATLAALALAATAAAQVLPPPEPSADAARGPGARPAPAETSPERAATAGAAAENGRRGGLPADATTRHVLELPDGRTLAFTATAGSLRLFDPRDGRTPQADVAYLAYALEGAAPRTRPVSFVLNGGPGASSAWLQLGALGPWRLPLAGDAALPSAAPEPVPNAETWLDFTDLVFLDPVGAGYSDFAPGAGEAARRRLWSVDGDVQSLAEVVRRWLEEHGRLASPKFLVGESYGGFRVPRMARVLQSEQGIGVNGLVLISPALDFGGRSAALDPLLWVARLPSMAAAARAAAGGEVDRATLAEAERYAAGDYLLDLLRAERDAEAAARLGERVAALTGLDPELVRRRRGRVGMAEFLHAIGGAGDRVASPYDASVTVLDPFPEVPAEARPRPDPVLDGMLAPLTGAMLGLYAERLGWRPEGRQYRLLNRRVAREWDWGGGRGPRPEAMSSLRTALALDPRLRVVVAHGLFDLVTPYFASRLLLDQIPERSGGDRVRLVAYPGGHMFYSLDGSRAALRAEARALVAAGR